MEFLDGLFSNISSTITNEDFVQEARRASCDFTRRRKFSLKDLTLTLLGFTKVGVQVEIDRFCSFLSAATTDVITYSKSAFSQARKKLNPEVFVSLRDKSLEYFNQNAPHKRDWFGHRIVAIDGSTLLLPGNEELAAHFGTFENQNPKKSVSARVSVAFDVCNNLALDATISPLNVGEQTLAAGHFDKLNPMTDIIVVDRGYASIKFIQTLSKKGFKFCFRLTTSWKLASRAIGNKTETPWSILKGQEYKVDGKEEVLDDDIPGLRLIQFPLPSGQIELLLTNLVDPEKYTVERMKHLYHMRWFVEEYYKRLKQVGQVEYFSGRTVEAIQQDFLARVVMLNLAAMIETQHLRPIFEEKSYNPGKERQPVQANRTQVSAKLKDFMYQLFWGMNPQAALRKMMQLLYKCYDVVRDNRSFERHKARKHRRKPLMYKAA